MEKLTKKQEKVFHIHLHTKMLLTNKHGLKCLLSFSIKEI